MCLHCPMFSKQMNLPFDSLAELPVGTQKCYYLNDLRLLINKGKECFYTKINKIVVKNDTPETVSGTKKIA